MAQPSLMKPISIFYSYAREDENSRQKLEYTFHT